jgi:hypothetical protein
MTSEPERVHDEPTENHKALASSLVIPQSAEKKKWRTPTVRVEKLVQTKFTGPFLFDGITGSIVT